MPEIRRPFQLILIRHAESTRNVAKKGATYFADEEARRTVKGISDYKIPITPLGIEQAQKTGVFLRNQLGAPDYIYHSGYLRTTQTLDEILKAFPIHEQHAIKIRMNQFIRERDPGYTYDMTLEEAENAFPWLSKYWSTFGGFLARPPGGESISDVTQRIHAFLNMLFRDRAGQKVWVVTHCGAIRAFRFLLEHWTYEEALHWPVGQLPENCSISRYDFDADKEHLVAKEHNLVCWK